MSSKIKKPGNIKKLGTDKSFFARPLVQRLMSAAVLIPMVLVSSYLGGRIFASLVAFACIIMVFEWTRMVEGRECSASFYVMALSATAAMFAAPFGHYEIAFAICAVSGVVVFVLGRREGVNGVWLALGAAYILVPSLALMWLRLDTQFGQSLTLMLFFVVWAADTGAFAFGKLIGGPKINHALSPSKTWAGIGGGVIGGSLVGAASAYAFFGPGAAWAYFLLGGILGAASVAGDLAESGIKRRFGIKDISGFIPGHGGALDRMDGMIFATLAMTGAYFIYILIQSGQG